MPHTHHNWDYVHINSIDPGRSDSCCCRRATPGRSSTSTCTPARFIWRIGGKYSSFKLGPGRRFYWQHDAAWQPGGLVSVFDNGGSPDRGEAVARVAARSQPRHQDGHAGQGSSPTRTQDAARLQPGRSAEPGDGNWLMGYGGLPNFTEYSSSGRCSRRDARPQRPGLPHLSRALERSAEDGARAGRRARAGEVTVQASWNGATRSAPGAPRGGLRRGAHRRGDRARAGL